MCIYFSLFPQISELFLPKLLYWSEPPFIYVGWANISQKQFFIDALKSGADARGCQCYQRSTTKKLTLTFIFHISFVKMMWTRFWNFAESSCGWHCSGTLTLVGGYNFSCCSVFNTICDSVQCAKLASLFSYN